jgi:hypothetical protein
MELGEKMDHKKKKKKKIEQIDVSLLHPLGNLENDWRVLRSVPEVACRCIDKNCVVVGRGAVGFVNVTENVKLWLDPFFDFAEQVDTPGALPVGAHVAVAERGTVRDQDFGLCWDL